MTNTFVQNLTNATNYKRTENGATAHRELCNKVLELFALGGAYRKRSDEDCILLFKAAYEENPELALKTLFYERDVRGGQGERRFFRTCLHWLAKTDPHVVRHNLENIPFYGRWDDLWFICTEDTDVYEDMIKFVHSQLKLDMVCKTPSLLAKWLPSEQAASAVTRRLAAMFTEEFGMTQRNYRKTLSTLRKKINVVERLMSSGEWDKIQYDKIPSKAGLIYRNAFARHDYDRYMAFVNSKNTKVNAGTLYPYEVVEKALSCRTSADRQAVNKYWDNLKDYFNGDKSNILCVVDTSASMWGTPINVAISLGMYCGERSQGPFHNKYISFSSYPQLIEIEGIDFVDKVKRIYDTNICQNTNLIRVFDLLLNIATQPTTKKEDIPEYIVVISDMEIDEGVSFANDDRWNWKRTEQGKILTEMETMRVKWRSHGVEMPKLVYWNVDARHNTFLDLNDNVSYVSGMSPSLFEQILTGKTGWELCLETILSDRYNRVSL